MIPVQKEFIVSILRMMRADIIAVIGDASDFQTSLPGLKIISDHPATKETVDAVIISADLPVPALLKIMNEFDGSLRVGGVFLFVEDIGKNAAKSLAETHRFSTISLPAITTPEEAASIMTVATKTRSGAPEIEGYRYQ